MRPCTAGKAGSLGSLKKYSKCFDKGTPLTGRKSEQAKEQYYRFMVDTLAFFNRELLSPLHASEACNPTDSHGASH